MPSNRAIRLVKDDVLCNKIILTVVKKKHSGVIDSVIAPTTAEIRLLEITILTQVFLAVDKMVQHML